MPPPVQKIWGAPISRPFAHPDFFGMASTLRNSLSGTRFKPNGQRSIRRMLQGRIPSLSVGRDAAGRKPSPTSRSTSNAASKTIIGPTSSMIGRIAPPPGQQHRDAPRFRGLLLIRIFSGWLPRSAQACRKLDSSPTDNAPFAVCSRGKSHFLRSGGMPLVERRRRHPARHRMPLRNQPPARLPR